MNVDKGHDMTTIMKNPYQTSTDKVACPDLNMNLALTCTVYIVFSDDSSGIVQHLAQSRAAYYIRKLAWIV